MSNDYIVPDSTLYKDDESYGLYDSGDNAVRVGVVRSSKEVEGVGTKYTVEVFMGGVQVPVSCVPITRFNSPYNFEEIRLKRWNRGPIASGLLPPGTASQYNMRDGETVVVAFLDGSSREGVILGSIKHPSRSTATEEETLAYHSVYNGLETTIDEQGAYTVTFQGAPVNDSIPVPPGLTEVQDTQYNSLVSGSFFGFDSFGNFTVDCSSLLVDNNIAVTKSPVGGNITITSGDSVIDLIGNPTVSEIKVSTGLLQAETLYIGLESETSIDILANLGTVTVKGLQIAIGNETIELIDGLLKIIEGIGQATVTSPVGTCTPIMASPQWTSSVLPTIIKLNTLKGTI